MNELSTGILMIVACSAGLSLSVIAVVSYLHYKENKKFNSLMKEMDGMGKNRYTLGKEYTEKEKGFE